LYLLGVLMTPVCLTIGRFTMFRKIFFAVALLSALVFLATSAKDNSSKVPYPENYRAWTHIKTLILLPGHPLYNDFGGIHHVYANEKALKTLRSGGNVFPDGSVLVFDLMEAPQKDNAISEGQRKVLAVMWKDSKKYQTTGGWGFEAFRGDTRERIVKDPVKECYNCHTGQKHHDFVFSQYRK